MNDISFKVSQCSGVTKIVNNTRHNLVISVKPIKPKRKHRDVFIIKPGCFMLDENHLTLEQLSFSLES